jgi:hypothetical protein
MINPTNDRHSKGSSQLEPDRPEHPGPSWGFMLALIFFAILVAIGFAWVFIHPLLHRH